MKSKFLAPLLAILWICKGCERKHDVIPPKEGALESKDFPARTTDELTTDLKKLKFVLSDVREASETEFSGSQSKLDGFLAELRDLLGKDQFEVTWIPESSASDDDPKGVVRVRALPEHVKNVEDAISQVEQEIQRRKATKEKSSVDQPAAAP
jgi:hypothetical protein